MMYLLLFISTVFMFTGFVLSFIRVKRNKLLTDIKMPPMENNKYLDYAFVNKGQKTSIVNFLVCVWFLIGVAYSLDDQSFYGISQNNIDLTLAGLASSLLSILITVLGEGRGFIKGLADLLTGVIVLYIGISVDNPALMSISILIGLILYVVFNGRFVFERESKHGYHSMHGYHYCIHNPHNLFISANSCHQAKNCSKNILILC